MISAEDARWIVSHLELECLVRRAFRAATLDVNAAVVLDMQTGELVARRWRPGESPDVEGVIGLALCLASQRAETEGRAAVYSEVPPSPEVVEETAVRAVLRHAVTAEAVEQQLRARFPELLKGERCT